MAELTTTIATYDDLAAAEADWSAVESTAKAKGIDLVDAALIQHDEDGKTITLHRQSRQGWGQGAVIGGLFAVLFPPSIIVGAAIGAGVGEVSAHLTRALDGDEIKELGRAMGPGEIALAAIVHTESAPELDLLLKGARMKVSRPAATVAELQAAVDAGGGDTTEA